MDFKDFIDLRGTHRIRAAQFGPIQEDAICRALEHWNVVQEAYVNVLAGYIKHILTGPVPAGRAKVEGLHRIFVIEFEIANNVTYLTSNEFVEMLSLRVARQVFDEHGLWRGIILYTKETDRVSNKCTYLFHFFDIIK